MILFNTKSNFSSYFLYFLNIEIVYDYSEIARRYKKQIHLAPFTMYTNRAYHESDSTMNVVVWYSKHVFYKDIHKALERLLGWIYWLMLTLLPILDQRHKDWVLQIAKVLLQISFKHSEPCLAFLVNF